MISDSERKMNSEYVTTLTFCLSKSLFFDEKYHFCLPASSGVLKAFADLSAMTVADWLQLPPGQGKLIFFSVFFATLIRLATVAFI